MRQIGGKITPHTSEQRRWQWQWMLDLVVSLAMLVASGFIVYSYFDAKKPTTTLTAAVPREPLSLEGAAVRGSLAAPVAIVSFSDFQCPFCGKFAEQIMPELDRRYFATGRAVFAFRHLPIGRIHPHAFRAAQIAECAGRQGRFWEAHDRLFANAKTLGGEYFIVLPEQLQLDRGAFSTCMDSQQPQQRVESDIVLAQRLGVKATPTFFIGTRLEGSLVQVQEVLSGVRSVEAFTSAIERALARTRTADAHDAVSLGIASRVVVRRTGVVNNGR